MSCTLTHILKYSQTSYTLTHMLCALSHSHAHSYTSHYNTHLHSHVPHSPHSRTLTYTHTHVTQTFTRTHTHTNKRTLTDITRVTHIYITHAYVTYPHIHHPRHAHSHTLSYTHVTHTHAHVIYIHILMQTSLTLTSYTSNNQKHVSCTLPHSHRRHTCNTHVTLPQIHVHTHTTHPGTSHNHTQIVTHSRITLTSHTNTNAWQRNTHMPDTPTYEYIRYKHVTQATYSSHTSRTCIDVENTSYTLVLMSHTTQRIPTRHNKNTITLRVTHKHITSTHATKIHK